MFKKYFRILAVIASLAVLCSISVSASITRASAYISCYEMDVLPAGSGRLAIEFSIEGTGTMSAIGARSISVYRQEDNKWIYDGGFDRNDYGMVDTNTGKHGNTMYYYGVPGTKYKVTVTLFAEKGTGSDSRTENFILTV